MQQVYHDQVVSYMLDEIKAGRTPNPDMLCNQQVKFGAFYKAIDHLREQIHSLRVKESTDIQTIQKHVSASTDEAAGRINDPRRPRQRQHDPVAGRHHHHRHTGRSGRLS